MHCLHWWLFKMKGKRQSKKKKRKLMYVSRSKLPNTNQDMYLNVNTNGGINDCWLQHSDTVKPITAFIASPWNVHLLPNIVTKITITDLHVIVSSYFVLVSHSPGIWIEIGVCVCVCFFSILLLLWLFYNYRCI